MYIILGTYYIYRSCCNVTALSDIDPRLSLLWRHSGGEGVSNHQPQDCLLNGSFRCRSKNASKLRVTGLCAGNSPERNGEFPAQMARNAEKVSIWWLQHVERIRNTQQKVWLLSTISVQVNIIPSHVNASLTEWHWIRSKNMSVPSFRVDFYYICPRNVKEWQTRRSENDNILARRTLVKQKSLWNAQTLTEHSYLNSNLLHDIVKELW